MSRKTLTPGSSTALERSRRSISASGTRGASKYLGAGQTRTRVPVWRPHTPLTTIGDTDSPPAPNSTPCTLPSRRTSTETRVDRALVTATPTPCRPPEKA